MKLTSKLLIGAGVLLVGLAVVYRAANCAPDKNLSSDAQMLQVINDGGCMDCHSSEPNLPFYANLPVAKSLIRKDIDGGYAVFDIAPLKAALENGTAPGEVDLAKTEDVIRDGSMPLAKYYLIHWGSSVTAAKKSAVLAGVRDLRAAYYPNPLASPEFANETIRPIPCKVDYDPAKAALGKVLYNDTRLSADGTISCATCHSIETAGVDNKRYSEGIDGQKGGVNAPTSFNACFNFVQFWDGRAADLAEQAGGPPLNPVEMGSKDFDEIAERIAKDRAFCKAFNAVYPEGLCQASITDAIAEYEKTLITPNSAFDRYLKGDKEAMSAEQIEGYAIFKDFGCATCHAGVNMGGLSYELMGRRANYFEDRELTLKSGLTDGDNGRWAQTGLERDRFRFKTPGLRNVALTWPYYHEGSVETLEQAIEMMSRYQCGKEMDEAQLSRVKAFLEAQTGELNEF